MANPSIRGSLRIGAAFLSIVIAASWSMAAEPAPAISLSVKDFLPPPANVALTTGPILPDKLADIKEVEFKTQAKTRPNFFESRDAMETLMARIRQMNGKGTDQFIETLRRDRPDLANLPFLLGGACRTNLARSRHFKESVTSIRGAIGWANLRNGTVRAESFWEAFEGSNFHGDGSLSKVDAAEREDVMLGRYSALTQVLASESPALRLGFVRFLSEAQNYAATRLLASLAVFSPEDEIRLAAIGALKDRRPGDYTDVLIKGLTYPWPGVVQHAADAAAKLDRTDLASRLVDMLDEPDPRAPFHRVINGKKTPVVREIVRINHERSCLLCHAPSNEETPSQVLTAQAQLLDQPRQSPEAYYTPLRPNQLVRIDVTYLRQDFSVMLPTASDVWTPMMSRFDFLVQERAISTQEERQYAELLATGDSDKLPPHRTAALEALRKLTGKNADPNAAAWRAILKMP